MLVCVLVGRLTVVLQSISDGAASVVVVSEAALRAHNLTPLARIVSWNVVGCDPTIMGIGPAPAIRNALNKANMTLGQMDLIEVGTVASCWPS